MWIGWRQMRYPKEFRIEPTSLRTDLVSAVRELAITVSSLSAASRVPKDPGAPGELSKTLADVGTSLWRLRQRMVDPATMRPLEETRLAYRHLEAAWDALTEAGLELQEHTDQPYDTGLSLNVLTFQPIPGLHREKVIETLSPTVYFKGRRIRTGQVIVGRPSANMRDGVQADGERTDT